MSPQPSTFAVAKTIAQGMRDHCLEVGPSRAAETWGIDRGTAADWRDSVDPMLPTAFAVVATIMQQKRDTGTSPLFDALDRMVNGPGEGTAEQVDRECMQALVELGALITEDAKALQGDQHVSLVEARRLLPLCEKIGRLGRILSSSLRDQIQRAAP